MITKPCKLNDPVEVQRLVNEYFQERKEQEEVRELKNGDKKIYRIPPTMIGLAAKLGINRKNLIEYINDDQEGIHESYNKEIRNILRDAKERIIQELTEGVSLGYWTEKIVLAQLTKYGEIGNDQEEKTVKIIMQGSNDWSR